MIVPHSLRWTPREPCSAGTSKRRAGASSIPRATRCSPRSKSPLARSALRSLFSGSSQPQRTTNAMRRDSPFASSSKRRRARHLYRAPGFISGDMIWLPDLGSNQGLTDFRALGRGRDRSEERLIPLSAVRSSREKGRARRAAEIELIRNHPVLRLIRRHGLPAEVKCLLIHARSHGRRVQWPAARSRRARPRGRSGRSFGVAAELASPAIRPPPLGKRYSGKLPVLVHLSPPMRLPCAVFLPSGDDVGARFSTLGRCREPLPRRA